jgi:stringent starvation protein B
VLLAFPAAWRYWGAVMGSNPGLPPKKDVALALLERSTVFIHLDPRHDTVQVPPRFKRQPQLVLQIGFNMPIPIPDLDLNDDGVTCTLSFSATPHFCSVPWRAIFALVGDDGRGMVWPDDVPREVAGHNQTDVPKPRAQLRAVPPGEAEQKKPKARRTRKRRAVKDAAAQPERSAPFSPVKGEQTSQQPVAPVREPDDSSASRSAPRKRELPPYLRVIK